MIQNFITESWKQVTLPIDGEFKLHVSNLGRVKTFNKFGHETLLKGSLTNGYKVVRLKLHHPRTPEQDQKLEQPRARINELIQQVKLLKKEQPGSALYTKNVTLLSSLRKKLAKEVARELKGRTIYFHGLIHRLVAAYFLPQPTPAHTVAAHLNHDKFDNHFKNIKWMTPEENYAHQKLSPAVIKHHENIKDQSKEPTGSTKLTVTKVMFLKKLLKEDKPLKQLTKMFKVSETQILRIKREENWKEVEAAP